MNRRVLLTTSWDDGHPLDTKIASVLEEFGFTGTFYASTGPDGHRLIDDRDLARIGKNHELGAHGKTHTIFPELSRAELAQEIEWAVRELSRFGNVGDVVAPPRGKINPATRRFLGRLGYVVRTGAVVGGTEVRTNALEPTFQLYNHRWKAIMRNYAYRRMIPSATFLMAIAREGRPHDRFRNLFEAAIRHRRYVHVWGHASDIERLDLWEALRRLLGTAADLGLTPVSNSDAFHRLSRRTRIQA